MIRNVMVKGVPLYLAILLPITAGLGVYAVTATINVQTLTEHAHMGVIFNETNAFMVTSTFLFPIGINTPASEVFPAPCSWAVAGCNTAETAGHWALGVQLTLNTAPSTTTTYAMHVLFGGPGFAAFGAQFGELVFSVSPGTVPSSTAFTFDTGTSSLNSPIIINIVVTTTL